MDDARQGEGRGSAQPLLATHNDPAGGQALAARQGPADGQDLTGGQDPTDGQDPTGGQPHDAVTRTVPRAAPFQATSRRSATASGPLPGIPRRVLVACGAAVIIAAIVAATILIVNGTGGGSRMAAASHPISGSAAGRGATTPASVGASSDLAGLARAAAGNAPVAVPAGPVGTPPPAASHGAEQPAPAITTPGPAAAAPIPPAPRPAVAPATMPAPAPAPTTNPPAAVAVQTLGAPVNIQATNVTSSSITIAWNAVAGAGSYRVRVTYQGQLVAQVFVAGTSATVTGLGADHTYTMHVASVNSAGTGPESNGPAVKTTR